MLSNDNDNNQPKPSAVLAAAERHLKYIDCEIQKLENAVRDDKTIKYMSQLEHVLKSLWQRVIQFMENELATNKNKSIKDEQKVAVLQQRYAKFKDSYISYLDKMGLQASEWVKLSSFIFPSACK